VISLTQRALLNNTKHSQQTDMPPAGFEPAISAGERPQTHALDRAATGTRICFYTPYLNYDFASVFVTPGEDSVSTVRGNSAHCKKKNRNYVLYDLRLPYDKWVPVNTAWHVLRLRMEERPSVWRVAANILNKQSQTADKGWSSSLGVGRGANNASQ